MARFGGTVGITARSAAPGSPIAGQIYYDTTDGNLYVYDGVATTWVDLTVQGGAAAATSFVSQAKWGTD